MRCDRCGEAIEIKLMAGVPAVQKTIDFFELHKKCAEPVVKDSLTTAKGD
jgi:hypothetical protein